MIVFIFNILHILTYVDPKSKIFILNFEEKSERKMGIDNLLHDKYIKHIKIWYNKNSTWGVLLFKNIFLFIKIFINRFEYLIIFFLWKNFILNIMNFNDLWNFLMSFTLLLFITKKKRLYINILTGANYNSHASI